MPAAACCTAANPNNAVAAADCVKNNPGAGDGVIIPPHSRFHPVPTRPVFVTASSEPVLASPTSPGGPESVPTPERRDNRSRRAAPPRESSVAVRPPVKPPRAFRPAGQLKPLVASPPETSSASAAAELSVLLATDNDQQQPNPAGDSTESPAPSAKPSAGPILAPPDQNPDPADQNPDPADPHAPLRWRSLRAS
jgi:hypothetical protein